ncbi:50S ribosomal protein L23 [Ventosimonas gracilis]|uniref:Large ribosomal subunit protein uL23 n=1 Tax=Ventosimonas gracilis TaxID=1680762 RepID=A0A139SWP3_9GAMM|nr:50S ribosomal protein L23 [Ventosimonas gracilis]KXU39023.1 50S ribosomal protein L23 [Ventosimonas gracilis]
MNQERLFQVLQGARVSDKAAGLAVAQQYIFHVAADASKLEIKKAVESLYEVKVANVNTLNVLGKSKRNAKGVQGKRADWKKAVVSLAEGHKLALLGELE